MRKILVLLVLVASACGSNSATAPAAGGAGKDAGNAKRVEIIARDYAFEPSQISVAAGKVTFAVKNTGGEEHEFEIFKGKKVVDEVEGIAPGITRSVTVDLEAGSYTFVCKLADHEARGMKGTLTVT